ncbi:MAG: hypothetical protein AAF583_00650 [Pseudomonadota bacterium]
MMAHRSDREPGHPAECPRHQSLQSRVGPSSRIPSWPAVQCSTAQTGRTEDCTRPIHQTLKSTLVTREPAIEDSPIATQLPPLRALAERLANDGGDHLERHKVVAFVLGDDISLRAFERDADQARASCDFDVGAKLAEKYVQLVSL